MEAIDGNIPPECDASEASCSVSVVRVKLVSEINDKNNSVNGNSAVKRKFSNDETSTDEEGDEASSKKTKNMADENTFDGNAVVSTSSNTECGQANSVKLCLDEDIAGQAAGCSDGDPVIPAAADEMLPANEDPCSSSADAGIVLIPVKNEPVDADNSLADAGTSTETTNNADIKPAVTVKKEEATSTSRESCKFGIRCYRRNPMHRIEEAHPGDHDYKRPSFPPPPAGTPDCPYGDACYRRNPMHFEQFNHPPETDFEQNWKNYRSRLRQRRQRTQDDLSNDNGESSDFDDYDMEDPFIDDGDLDEYVPSGNDDDDDDEYDECDKAEE